MIAQESTPALRSRFSAFVHVLGISGPLLRGATQRKLALDQLGIEAAAREKAFMGSSLDEAPGIEHCYQLRVAHRRQPMGDDDGGAIAHQLDQRVPHLPLADRVEMRGRLVEDQYRRVLEEGARDRDALALSAGELDAALADTGLEPLGQSGDEVAECRAFEGLRDLRVAGPGLRQSNIGAQRIVEEVGILRHEGDAAAQFVKLVLAQIVTVER